MEWTKVYLSMRIRLGAFWDYESENDLSLPNCPFYLYCETGSIKVAAGRYSWVDYTVKLKNALRFFSKNALRTLRYTYFWFTYNFSFNVIFAIRTKIWLYVLQLLYSILFCIVCLMYVLHLTYSISFCVLCLMYSESEETRQRSVLSPAVNC